MNQTKSHSGILKPIHAAIRPHRLEDGKKFKSLKRHLATHHNLTPDEYRQKWNLPADYPMVSPSYSNERSVMAKTMGLGRKRASSKEPAKIVAPVSRKKIGLKFT